MCSDKQRIYADLNKWDKARDEERRYVLTCMGTLKDLRKYNVEFVEGEIYHFWMDDGDEKGNPDPIYFEGTVEYDSECGYWGAWVHSNSFSHASDAKA